MFVVHHMTRQVGWFMEMLIVLSWGPSRKDFLCGFALIKQYHKALTAKLQYFDFLKTLSIILVNAYTTMYVMVRLNFASEFHSPLLIVLVKIRAFNIEILLMLIGHRIL